MCNVPQSLRLSSSHASRAGHFVLLRNEHLPRCPLPIPQSGSCQCHVRGKRFMSDSQISNTTRSIGWMSMKGLSTSWVWPRDSVSGTSVPCWPPHPSLDGVAPRRRLLRPADLAVDLARTAVGLFIMLARQSGTRYQMNSEIWTALIVSETIILFSRY